jgi:ketosteroid isomerase-like protein
MTLDAASAREILDASHIAWSKGDVDGVLEHYLDNVTYWSNSGGLDGGALTFEGKAALRAFLQSIVDVAESMLVTDLFVLNGNVGRATVECYIRHKGTGHTLSGSYRQLVTFEGDKIAKVEEFHDAAKMAAFWRLIAGETAKQPPLTV